MIVNFGEVIKFQNKYRFQRSSPYLKWAFSFVFSTNYSNGFISVGTGGLSSKQIIRRSSNVDDVGTGNFPYTVAKKILRIIVLRVLSSVYTGDYKVRQIRLKLQKNVERQSYEYIELIQHIKTIFNATNIKLESNLLNVFIKLYTSDVYIQKERCYFQIRLTVVYISCSSTTILRVYVTKEL